jgi:hypothetical protein
VGAVREEEREGEREKIEGTEERSGRVRKRVRWRERIEGGREKRGQRGSYGERARERFISSQLK